MKKLLFVFIAVFMANLTYSQTGDLENQFYFRIGASMPSWRYMGADGRSDFKDASDDFRRRGGIFEMGSIFMLNGIKLMDGMRIGINVDYLSLNYNRFKSKDVFGGEGYKFTTFFWGAKFGPSFSYSPVDKLVFDGYLKFNPVWVSTAISKAYESTDIEDSEIYMGFFGTKMSVGFNVRYSVMMLGFEFNPGIVKYKYYDQDNDELTDTYLGNNFDQGNDDSDYSKVRCTNITFGLSF
jgi:hypothetical protein